MTAQNAVPQSHVFVITYGRTGSTLVQGLLNSLPSCTIYGENEGFLLHLFEAFEALKIAHNHLKNPKLDQPKNSWYGSSRYKEEHVVAAFRDLADDVLFSQKPDLTPIDSKIVGFKEIRHIFIGSTDLSNYLDFLLQLYPDARFIFHTRDVDSVLSSGWWKRNDPTHTRKQIELFEAATTNFIAKHAQISLRTTYEELVESRTRWSALCSFLGVEYDEEAMQATIDQNHSYEQRELTFLLTGKRADISLLNKPWWRSSVDECSLSITPDGTERVLSGALLPRAGIEIEPLAVFCNDSVIPIESGRPSPEMAVEFPFNPRSGACGLAVLLPIVAHGRVLIRAGEMEIAEVLLRQ